MINNIARPIAIAAALTFAVSSVFPIVAGLAHNTESFPKLWGILDVGIAFLLAALAFAGLGITHGRIDKEVEYASYHAYRVVIHGVIAVLVVFILGSDRVVWVNCLTGLAWRYWLLLY